MGGNIAAVSDHNLHLLALKTAEKLPGVEGPYRFSQRSDAEAIKVCGKWFLLLANMQGRPIVNLKAEPDDVFALLQSHPAARPAWHMNKKHWFTLESDVELSEELLSNLIVESYLTVVSTLPVAKRPAGWDEILPA